MWWVFEGCPGMHMPHCVLASEGQTTSCASQAFSPPQYYTDTCSVFANEAHVSHSFLSNPTAEGWWKNHQNRTWAADPQLAKKGCRSLFLQSTGAHLCPHHREAEFKCHREWANGKHSENWGRGGSGEGFADGVSAEVQGLHPARQQPQL